MQKLIMQKLNMQKLNTHHYDGKLTETVKLHINEITAASLCPSEIKLAAFSDLKDRLNTLHMSLIANNMFDCIVSSYENKGRNSPANYDPTNNLHADDLLYMCCTRVDIYGDDFCNILIEQLEGMSTGNCPQGRTTRLFQVIVSTD